MADEAGKADVGVGDGGNTSEWLMAGEVIEAHKWIHRLQFAQAMVDWRLVIRRIWSTKSLLRRLYQQ